MVDTLQIGDQLRQTHVPFRYKGSFEKYINSIDEGYDAEDSIFNGYIYNINSPQFNLVKRSRYGKCCDFRHETIECRCKNCFIPTKAYCFVKCVNFLTGEDYKEQYLDSIRNEKKAIENYD